MPHVQRTVQQIMCDPFFLALFGTASLSRHFTSGVQCGSGGDLGDGGVSIRATPTSHSRRPLGC